MPAGARALATLDDAAEHGAAFETPTCAHSAATEWLGKRIGGGVRGIALRDCARDAPWQLCPAAHEDVCVKEYPDVYEPTVRSSASSGCAAYLLFLRRFFGVGNVVGNTDGNTEMGTPTGNTDSREGRRGTTWKLIVLTRRLSLRRLFVSSRLPFSPTSPRGATPHTRKAASARRIPG